jgi:hypothetical protein
MPTVTFFPFLVANLNRGIVVPYQSYFVPRVGDKISLGDSTLEVVDVVVESAQADGGGVQHNVCVHGKEVAAPAHWTSFEYMDVNEYCRAVKD